MAGRGVEFQLHGYNRLMNKFRRLAADNPELTDAPLGRFAKSQRALLKAEPYPSKTATQRYQRTGQLASRWKAVQEAPGRWAIVNHARGKGGQLYAGYVVGMRQAWMHAKRWWKAHDILKRNLPELTKELTEVIKKIWND